MTVRQWCGGKVRTLRDQHVLLTGKVWVKDRREIRDDLDWRLVGKGASIAPDRSRDVTLLVLGDLSGQHVVDPVNLRSRKVRFVAEERDRGNHICVVDSAGLSALLDGHVANCLDTRLVGGARGRAAVEVSKPAAGNEAGASGVLGSRLLPRAASVHKDDRLELDLSALDRATEAHELILKQLREHLTGVGVTARSPGPGMPWFDAGWRSPQDESELMIAEVKSLTGAVESQQIRLGLGQVLDYAHTVGSGELGSGLKVVPVLVLQHEPGDRRWTSLADSLGVVLTWAPDFPGV